MGAVCVIHHQLSHSAIDRRIIKTDRSYFQEVNMKKVAVATTTVRCPQCHKDQEWAPAQRNCVNSCKWSNWFHARLVEAFTGRRPGAL